jgi:hypothetical protein
MTRDEALLWLNDRCGHSADLTIEYDQGDATVALVTAAGKLCHWSSQAGEEVEAAKNLGRRDDIAGWYKVGTTGFDISDLGEASYDTSMGELQIELVPSSVVLRVAVYAEGARGASPRGAKRSVPGHLRRPPKRREPFLRRFGERFPRPLRTSGVEPTVARVLHPAALSHLVRREAAASVLAHRLHPHALAVGVSVDADAVRIEQLNAREVVRASTTPVHGVLVLSM